MLIGEYRYSIDDKKRVSIPAKWQSELGKKVIVTRGLDGCLFLYSQKEWKKLVEKISKLPLGQRDSRGFQRIMLSGAMEVSIDTLGRILIPDYLKKYADLKKKVVIVGLYNHAEIWDEGRWEEYQAKSEKEVGDMAERLSQLI
ncbi:MAG TPA: division/cell wall cluster transcriptional repressor MraZ [Candidatus Pacearchaeota archaeon]|nr:division/cell wall cluster transcriptional repressor MraZ [Candidatus Pacearchaeota archaeon]HOK94169.1 division/cell wall cluster transcriptional repressor MraZ [Candidatus Pacearchaeota archaeon]HPO75191.1 division/cell wall cluster transcriptional repressor MraZ [Candidatus Pacearchaeota archaeon]